MEVFPDCSYLLRYFGLQCEIDNRLLIFAAVSMEDAGGPISFITADIHQGIDYRRTALDVVESSWKSGLLIFRAETCSPTELG